MTEPSTVYHSVQLPVAEAMPLQRYDDPRNRGVALVHDLLAGPLPPEFDQADVLYCEPPWRSGFDAYNMRAGVNDDRTYSQLLAAISEIIESTTTPVIVVVGAHARAMLPMADVDVPIMQSLLPRRPIARAFAYRCPIPSMSDHTELLTWLAMHYECVGDFLGGYGWSGRIFAELGKRFVLSDYNPRCIGQIAAASPGWHGERA